MAVAPTGNIFKALSFDNVSSRTYGVYITGEAVYNAPEREVEMISIPGRNGAFALDKGRFENIEVTYPAGIFADSETNFADAISEFRNFLCSRKGYVRLQDEYNPNEYRMAIYKSGLEVEPAQLKAGEFEITFDCKPQRFLTSGETAVTVSSGDTLTNPTRFESSPLLEVEGYGTIETQSDSVVVNDIRIGTVTLVDRGVLTDPAIYDSSNYNLLNNGDDIVLQEGTALVVGVSPYGGYASDSVTSMTATVSSSEVSCHINVIKYGKNYIPQIVLDEPITQPKGTAVTKQIEISISATYKYRNVAKTYSGTMTVTCAMGTLVRKDLMTFYSPSFSPALPADLLPYQPSGASTTAGVIGESTKTVTGDEPVFIDLDIGEAYIIVGGEVSSLNKYIDLGSKLMTLKSGVNEITYDNTITSLKVTPRWWKI